MNGAELIAYAIVALSSGLLTKFIAEKKNRDGALAFVWGFFFDFWAILIYLFLSKKEKDGKK